MLANVSWASIGNDIVDRQFEVLDEARNPKHDRYIDRVLSGAEKVLLKKKKMPLQVFWAAKEAAYKALKRMDNSVFFTPSEYVYSPEDHTVTWRNYTVHCRVRSNKDWIYAAAEIGHSENERVFHWFDYCYEDESSAVRKLAQRRIADLFEIDAGRVKISRGRGGNKNKTGEAHSYIPKVYVDGKPTEHQLSLTHHGRYIACMFYPMQGQLNEYRKEYRRQTN